MLPQALQFLFPQADPLADYRVSDEGKGAFISEWRLPQPQPTDSELAAVLASPEFAAWQQAKVDALARESRRTVTEQAERRTLEEGAKVAIARLDQIIGSTVPFTALGFQQLVAAVQDVARYQKRLIKIIARTES